MLTACTSDGGRSGADDSVDQSSLYQDTSGLEGGAAAGASDLPPVLSEDDSFPRGHTGEIVPPVGAQFGEITAQQRLVLNTAYYLAVKKCMKDQGFTLLDPPPKLETTADSGPILFDAYIGILDAEYANKYGYQLYKKVFTDDPGNLPQQRVNGDAKYEYALKEVGNGGCSGEAASMIEKNVPSEDESSPIVATIYQDSLNATYADPAYKKAVQSWSTCMKDAGFDYASPEKAFKAFDGFQVTAKTAFDRSVPHPSVVEVNTAVTDVECKRSSRIADVFRKVFWNRQVAMAEKNRPTLKVIEEVQAQKLKNAQRMIKMYG